VVKLKTGIARRRLAWLMPPAGTVLDVGCGDFRKAYRYLYGTNESLRFVGLERFADATIYGSSTVASDVEATGAFRRIACDIETEAFPVADESVDGIFCSHVIEHVENKVQLLKEMDRVLKRGGFAYIETPGPRSIWMPPGSWLQPVAASAGYPLNFKDDASHVGSPLSLAHLQQLITPLHWTIERKGYNRELGVAGIPVYAAMMLTGLLPFVPARIRGLLIGAGWWNLIGWPEYILAKKADGSASR
jgi:SAM-dependent methyltransferase